MNNINSRERVINAIERKPVDRVPIDLGGYQSGICWKAYERLKKAFNIEKETEILELNQMLAKIDEEILNKFHIDTRYVFPAPGRDPVWKDDETYIDEWGIKWHRPPSSNYYDMIISPLNEVNTAGGLKRYSWPEAKPEKRCKGLKEKAARIREETDYALFTSLAGVFEQSWYLRGMESFFMDIVEKPSYIEALLDQVLEVELTLYEPVLDEIGEYLDCVEFWGDFGGQRGPLINPKFYRKVVKPRQKKLINFFKSKTDAKIAWHSCGSCEQFIPDFIELGIDLLNPVQTNAAGMDPRHLKREYGKYISFWGGIDGQRLLPRGEADEVREEVKKMINILSDEHGGYLIASCHNIQNDVPADNIIALFETAFESGNKV